MKIITSVILTAVFLIYGCGKMIIKFLRVRRMKIFHQKNQAAKQNEAAVESLK